MKKMTKEKEHQLAEDLKNYTNPDHPEYDPIFTEKVRKIRPSWVESIDKLSSFKDYFEQKAIKLFNAKCLNSDIQELKWGKDVLTICFMEYEKDDTSKDPVYKEVKYKVKLEEVV